MSQSSLTVHTRKIYVNSSKENEIFASNAIRLVGYFIFYPFVIYFTPLFVHLISLSKSNGTLCFSFFLSISTDFIFSTCKYSLYSFLPRFLLEQFRRYSNVFFLIIVLLQVCVLYFSDYTVTFSFIKYSSVDGICEFLQNFSYNYKLVKVKKFCRRRSNFIIDAVQRFEVLANSGCKSNRSLYYSNSVHYHSYCFCVEGDL